MQAENFESSGSERRVQWIVEPVDFDRSPVAIIRVHSHRGFLSSQQWILSRVHGGSESEENHHHEGRLGFSCSVWKADLRAMLFPLDSAPSPCGRISRVFLLSPSIVVDIFAVYDSGA
ncbi:hypothetical protein R1flu_023361 [Riccia fluitans]|uniref:Uncharacterized protein n=1 Tax=Riccia fluitans TaxID=41844 RepID=A0ABD1XSB6_9MARC